MKEYGADEFCAVLLHNPELDRPDLEQCETFGRTRQQISDYCASADVMWNFGCSFRQPLLSLCNHRVLIDGDPGHLQISALAVDLDLEDHDLFFSVGGKLGDDDCDAPTLGLRWRPFLPLVYLPMWTARPDPGPGAPFTSITQWNWESSSSGTEWSAFRSVRPT